LLFVPSKTTEFGGPEKHFLDLLPTVKERQLHRLIVCFDQDIIVLLYRWIEGFPWQASVAALLAGGRKRFSIHRLIALLPAREGYYRIG
jgi:hypothetical protein